MALLIASGSAGAEEAVQLQADHPQRYVVMRGDTLWGIAGKFLANPWQWPEIWRDNPQIADPHSIYPGDELVLENIDGHPHLQVARRGADAPYYAADRPDFVKLSPVIRAEPLQQAIPTIPLNAIQPFLMQTKVVNAGEMEQAPYIIDFADEHIVGGAGDRIYVRGLPDSRLSGYMVFRPGVPYKDAETGEILGYEALYVADVEFQTSGEPSTLLIIHGDRDVRIGDRLLPAAPEQVRMNYHPRAPAKPVAGHIIAVVDGVSQIGQYNVVIIDRGAADGLEQGHVLEIQRGGQTRIYRAGAEEIVNLPPEKAGWLMIFRPYERVSYGLVLNAIRAIQLNDLVKSPL